MRPQIDRILEGVQPMELIQLQALAASGVVPGQTYLRPLEDKGWVETIAGTPIITMTGRTLLDGAAGHR